MKSGKEAKEKKVIARETTKEKHATATTTATTAEARLSTIWGEQVAELKDKNQVLSEHPRPSMVRKNWQSLNGLWQYAFSETGETPHPCEGEILVPFSPETRLSGVEKQLLPGQALWYERQVSFSQEIQNQLAAGGRLLLHFGAVDQCCEVFVNGKIVGSHVGGYLPFTFDITEFLEEEQNNHQRAQMHERECRDGVSPTSCTICVKVTDVTDTSFYSVGKQTLTPGGMYYPATSGIWQTVWLEAVPSLHIAEIDWETKFDEAKAVLTAILSEKNVGKSNATEEKRTDESDAEQRNEKIRKNCYLKVEFLHNEYSTVTALLNKEGGCDDGYEKEYQCEFSLPDFQSWSPENPYLYEVRLSLYADEEMLEKDIPADTVESYFAMRKCSIGTDAQGIRRIFLNNRPYMQVGVLDQGYFPESMYTAPTDEAMIYDIKTMKELGFNMLRKHVKVEPERWYYHCDRLGMLVWQDMVNGGRKNKSWYVTYLATAFQVLGIKGSDRHRFLLSRQDKAGREMYVRELTEMVQILKKHPSIVCFVPFNEGWGQFETNRMTEIVREIDKSVIVDSASGWYDMGGGDLKSIHHYFFKLKYKREKVRALALTEFGGYAQKVSGHSSHEEEYGYKTFSTKEELEKGYAELIENTVLPAVKDGISATIYTQLSDVEEEINGILTYDRKVLKMDGAFLRKWNEALKSAVQTEVL